MYNYTVINPEDCEFFAVAGEQELPPGERIYIEIDRKSIVMINLAGSYYAIADVCSHDDGPLGDGDLDGIEIICPRHGARFDIRSGKVLSLPAVEDIPAYPVRVQDGEIQIGIPLGE
jgi:3-phenylpropionate/trans-cinnamate dioxygenase ferredoxin subunit